MPGRGACTLSWIHCDDQILLRLQTKPLLANTTGGVSKGFLRTQGKAHLVFQLLITEPGGFEVG